MARKRYEDYRKIESQLASEKALRLDQESEIAEKDNIIKTQSVELGSLKQEIQRLRKQQGQVQSMKDAEQDLQNQMETNAILQKRLADMEGFKKDNVKLQGVIERMQEENVNLSSQVSGKHSFLFPFQPSTFNTPISQPTYYMTMFKS